VIDLWLATGSAADGVSGKRALAAEFHFFERRVRTCLVTHMLDS